MAKKVRYLIKGTYLTGAHEGETFLLRKGGYVTDETRYEWEDTTYKTYAIAARQCDRLEKQNEADYRFYQIENQRRIAKGYKPMYCPELEVYEPYAIEV